MPKFTLWACSWAHRSAIVPRETLWQRANSDDANTYMNPPPSMLAVRAHT
jgi:hypothetical protein